ncbi:MAG: sulfatase-like hydrolase/transferase [Alistipes shahii]
MLFENCYVSNAISGPSRACILTGKYSHVNGFTDNSRTFDGDQQTFPKLLHDAGYQTAMIGKWHLNSDPQGFDFWSILVGQGESTIRRCSSKTARSVSSRATSRMSSPTRPSGFSNGATSRVPSPCSTTTRPRTATGCRRSVTWASTTIGSSPSLSTCWTDSFGPRQRARGRAMEIGRDMWPEWTSS